MAVSRSFPTAGQSPIDVYNTAIRPGVYVDHIATPTSTIFTSVELMAHPTFTATGDYVNLWVETTVAGTLGTWASSIFAKIVQTVASVDGYICAAEFEVAKSGSIINRNYAIISLNNWNDIAGAQSISAFIKCNDYGDNVLNAFVHFASSAKQLSGSADPLALVCTNDGAETDCNIEVRFLVGNTPYWFLATNVVPS